MQTIIMTGASRGIGKVALHQLIASVPDLTLILVARKGSSLAWVNEEMSGVGAVHLVEADLNSIASTTAAATHIEQLIGDDLVPAPSALILNAGIQHTDACTPSPDGLEDTFAVNAVANHVLVSHLAPLTRPGGRLVITVSDTHFGDLRHNLGMVPGPQWQEPHRLAQPGTFPNPTSVSAGRTAYSTSKLAAIYQIHAYARRYPHLTVLAYNPGFVPGTGLARNAGPVSRFAMAHLMPVLARTPIASSTDAAGQELADLASDKGNFATGSYINRTREETSSPESYNLERENDLASYLDNLVDIQPSHAKN